MLKKELPSPFQKDSSFSCSFLLIQFSWQSFVPFPFWKRSLSSEAEADPCVYPPLAGQVRAEVSRVGSVQVGVPV